MGNSRCPTGHVKRSRCIIIFLHGQGDALGLPSGHVRPAAFPPSNPCVSSSSPSVAAVELGADAPLQLPYKALLSTLSSMAFSEGEAQRLVEVLSDRAGVVQGTWHTVRRGTLLGRRGGNTWRGMSVEDLRSCG